jgi:hypothetical protein
MFVPLRLIVFISKSCQRGSKVNPCRVYPILSGNRGSVSGSDPDLNLPVELESGRKKEDFFPF